MLRTFFLLAISFTYCFPLYAAGIITEQMLVHSKSSPQHKDYLGTDLRALARDSAGMFYVAGQDKYSWNPDALLLKVDSTGMINSKFTLEDGFFYDVAVGSQGIYATGTHYTKQSVLHFNGDCETLFTKTDLSLNKQWSHTLRGHGSGEAIATTTDYGRDTVVIAATQYLPNFILYHRLKQQIFVANSHDGNLRHSKDYGNNEQIVGEEGETNRDIANALVAASNNDIFMAGEVKLAHEGGYRTYASLVKRSNVFDYEWMKIYFDDYTFSTILAITTDNAGNVFIAGVRDKETFVCKLNSAGKIVWGKVLSDFSAQIKITALSYDQQFLYAAGSLESEDEDSQMYLAKLDGEGNISWEMKSVFQEKGEDSGDSRIADILVDKNMIYGVGSYLSDGCFIRIPNK